MNLVTGEMAPMEKLRAPFPASETGQLPRGGTTLAYVGHAAITGRLLDVDPSWQWEPMAITDEGLPRFDRDKDGNRIGLWIKLTVCGVTRLGYGSCPPNQFDAVKVLVGDALRNAAMRFGVALDLWVKGSPELPTDAEPERPYMSGMNVKRFIDSCVIEECHLPDRDKIVSKATDGRTINPEEVFADEVTVLRAAFESWQAEHQKVAPSAGKPNWQPVPTTPVGETPEALKGHSGSGKRVAKGVGPSTEGVTDLKVPSEVV